MDGMAVHDSPTRMFINGGGAGCWKQNLYLLQERAPRPKAVKCRRANMEGRPPYYGVEFHGLINRVEAEKMLREVGDGAYLVRASSRSQNAYTLCMLFDGKVLNYKLYCIDGAHLVAEKRFDTLESLVHDGLICMYVEKHAADYVRNMAEEAIYEQSPYSQFSRRFNRTVAPSTGDGAAAAVSPRSLRLPSTKSTSSSTATSYRRDASHQTLATLSRCHNFSSFTFKMPHYCDYCRNFLWGLVQQGMRCADCGFAAHKKCSEKALHDCHPEAKYVKRMFAVDLTTLCIAHCVDVPPVLLQCIEEVESRGLDVEGIYRVPGSHEQMDRLRRQFDVSAKVDLAQVEDIHTVASLLKLYLRLLPQQLVGGEGWSLGIGPFQRVDGRVVQVPFSIFRSLLQCFNTHRSPSAIAERVRSCRKTLNELNEANLQTLRVLLSHLRLVSSRSQENKMSVENLATIFSPTIFSTGEWGTVPALSEQQHVLLSFLIMARSVTMN